MLDRSKLAQELHKVAETVFFDNSAHIKLAQETWKRIAHHTHATFASHNTIFNTPFSLPSWDTNIPINQTISVNQKITHYHILSVDGSQIYPDRHYGPSCFLINIGSIAFNYGTPSRVHLFSQPSIFSAYDEKQAILSTDRVNCIRQELEFNEGLKQGLTIKRTEALKQTPLLLLFDGSLIFWLLESKESALQDHFLQKYVATLDHMYRERLLVAGYISFPKSRELVNILRLALANFNSHTIDHYPLDTIFDTTITHFFLKPGERTIVFQNNATISNQYPQHLHPHFFYINGGTEIGRIEIPAWIARDNDIVNYIARIIMDQCHKGQGYPIALAEAHEAAVVKGPDREFFYHLLEKMALDRNQQSFISQKSKCKKQKGF